MILCALLVPTYFAPSTNFTFVGFSGFYTISDGVACVSVLFELREFSGRLVVFLVVAFFC